MLMGRIRTDRLRQAMEGAGLDQSALARAVGCTPGAINQILQGNVQRSRFIPDILRELGITLGWLLGNDDEMRPSGYTEPAIRPVEQALIQRYRALPSRDAQVVQRIVAALSDTDSKPSTGLPDQGTLTQIFEGLLAGIKPEASLAERAELLAQRLPKGLEQARDLRLVPIEADLGREPEAPEGVAKHLPARRQRQRT